MPQVVIIAARAKVGKAWLAQTDIHPIKPASITATPVTGKMLIAMRVDSVDSFA